MTWRSLSFRTPKLHKSHKEIPHTCAQSQSRKIEKMKDINQSSGYLECPDYQEKLNKLHGRRSLKAPSVDMMMMLSLPREGSGSKKKHPTREESFLHRRNLSVTSFRQFLKT
jgi:hypothetical protein